MSDDKFNLERFVSAQNGRFSGYLQALNEMKTGGKRGHWIWYIFPQMEGLGSSGMCRAYSIHSEEEAKVYLEHPVLGKRLREITEVVLSYPKEANPDEFMLWSVDAKKLKSSMTLFDLVSPNDIFAEVLDKFFKGQRCRRTYAILGKSKCSYTNIWKNSTLFNIT